MMRCSFFSILVILFFLQTSLLLNSSLIKLASALTTSSLQKGEKQEHSPELKKSSKIYHNDDGLPSSSSVTVVLLNSTRYQVVILIADPQCQSMTYISELYMWQDSFSSWSGNLVYNWSHPAWANVSHARLSTSSLTLGEHEWYPATKGAITSKNGDVEVVIDGIQLGHAAIETWTISVNSTQGFSWKITREYIQDIVNRNASRYATLAMLAQATGYNDDMRKKSQIPSTIDSRFQWNMTTGTGFNAPLGEVMPYGDPGYWTYTYLNAPTSTLLMSPADAVLQWTKSIAVEKSSAGKVQEGKSKKEKREEDLMKNRHKKTKGVKNPPLNNEGENEIVFAFQWPWWPGTGEGDTSMAIGLISNPKYFPSYVPSKTVEEVHFVLEYLPLTTYDVAPFYLKTKNATFNALAANMSRVFNMWAGNVYGNSPSSCTCIHEMSFFSQIAATLFPSPAQKTQHSTPKKGSKSSEKGERGDKEHPDDVDSSQPELHQCLRFMLKMFAEHAIMSDGHVYPRWQQYQYWYMAIYDQIPQFLMAYYHYAVMSGDKQLMTELWPQLMQVMDYMLIQMKMGQDGVATSPNVSGLPNSNVADNWFDIVDFGGKDAIINSYAVTALHAYEEMAEWVGDNVRAKKFKLLHQLSVMVYHDVFFNASIGLYGDWVDIADRRRNYFYIWQQAIAMDPLSGLTNATRRREMIKSFDKLYERIFQQHYRARRKKKGSRNEKKENTNLGASSKMTPEERLWCTPTNFISVAPEDSFFNGSLQNQAVYGNYENGCCFMLFTGFEIGSRGYGGDSEGGYQRLVKVLEMYNTTRLWGQHYNWLGSDPQFLASDVLTDTLMILWGATRGLFGFTTTLTHGIWIDPNVKPPSAFEGAEHKFYYLGSPMTVKVVNGKTVLVS